MTRMAVPHYFGTLKVLEILYILTSLTAVCGIQLEDFFHNLDNSVSNWMSHNNSKLCTILLVHNNGRQHDQFEQEVLERFLTKSVPKTKAAAILTKILDLNQTFSSGEQVPSSTFNYLHHFTKEPCTIALYFISMLDYLEHLPDNFIAQLPGGTFRSFHIFFFMKQSMLEGFRRFADSLIQQNIVQQFPIGFNSMHHQQQHLMKKYINFKRIHHLLIVQLEKCTTKSQFTNSTKHSASSWEINNLVTFNVWFNRTIKLGRTKNNLFPNKWKYLNEDGEFLEVATTPDVTQEKLNDYLQTKVVKSSGYSVLGFYELLRYTNTTPKFINSRVFGIKKPDGTWIGLMGTILDGNAKISAGLAFTLERWNDVSFSITYHYDKIIFLTGLPKKLTTNSNHLIFLTQPFQIIVWLNIITIFFGIYLILLLNMKYCLQNQLHHNKAKNMVLLGVILRPALDQPNPTTSKIPDTLTRSLLAIWLFGLIVLNCGYKSSLISILLAPTIINPPKTFIELIHSNYKIGAVLYNESLTGEKLRALNNSISLEIDKRVKAYSFLSAECYLPIENIDNQQVCLGIYSFMLLAGNNFLTDKNGQSLFKISEDSTLFIFAGIGVPKQFPHLLETFNLLLDRSQQAGLIKYFLTLEKRYRNIQGRKYSMKYRNNQTTKLQQTQAHEQKVKPFFSILKIGYGISFGIFLLEIMVHFCKKMHPIKINFRPPPPDS